MALESATYLDDLVTTNPVVGDTAKTLADHIWLLKTVLQTTFPNIDAAVSATPTALNYVAGVTAGTSAASKALVLDSSSNLSSGTLNNLTAAGTVAATTVTGALNGTITTGTTAVTQTAANNSTKVATTAYIDRHPYIPLQRFRDAQGTNFSTGSTNYTRVSDEYTITPTEANTKLEGYFVVNCRVTVDDPASSTSATASFKAGYRNSSGTGVDFGSTQSIYVYEQGDQNSRAVQGSMTIPFSVSSSQVDASGNWDLHVRGKVSGADDTLDTLLTYLVAEEFIE